MTLRAIFFFALICLAGYPAHAQGGTNNPPTEIKRGGGKCVVNGDGSIDCIAASGKNINLMTSGGGKVNITGPVTGTATSIDSTGTASVKGDSDLNATGNVDFMIGNFVGARLSNNKSFNFFGTYTNWTASAPQPFSQIDQPTGIPTLAAAGHIFTTTPSSLGTFGIASTIFANNNSHYVVGVVGEGRTTTGQSSTAEVDGINGVVDTNATHTGQARAGEFNINVAQNLDGLNYVTHTSAIGGHYTAGLFLASGGITHPHVGLYFTQTLGATNNWVRNIVCPDGSFQLRCLDVGLGVDPSLAGYISLGVKSADTGIVMQRGSDSGLSGYFMRLRNSANNSDVYNIGLDGQTRLVGANFQFWKNSTPTVAYLIGNSLPNLTVDDDFRIGRWDGSTWTEKLRYTSTNDTWNFLNPLQANQYMDFLGVGTPPAVSLSGYARLYFNFGTSRLQLSQSGGAFANVALATDIGVTAINGNSSAAQTIAAGPNLTVTDVGATHTIACPTCATLSDVASLSPLATVNSVDLNTTSATTLYTCPVGKSCLIHRVIVYNASTSLTTASYAFGWTSPNYNDVIANATHTELTTSTVFTIMNSKTAAKIGVAGDVFKIKPTIAQGSAASVSIQVFGTIY